MSIDGIDLTPSSSNESSTNTSTGLSVNVGGSRGNIATQSLIDTMINESGEIQTAMGTLIPLEVPVIDDAMFHMMADRIAPELKGLVDSVQKIQNYQVNNSQPVEINVHYDSLVNVEGNVDKDALPDLETILKESYTYSTKRLHSELRRIGYGLH